MSDRGPIDHKFKTGLGPTPPRSYLLHESLHDSESFNYASRQTPSESRHVCHSPLFEARR